MSKYSDNVFFFSPINAKESVPKTICFFFPNTPRMTPGKMPSGSTTHCGNPRHNVFSAERAAHLDSRLRRFLYRPDQLAERYVKPGNRVLDFGCGPGFFTREFAKRVGDTGMVLAVDVQEEMLRILRPEKIPGNPRGICGTTEKNLKKATFAGGCFWCLQPPFQLVEGVVGAVAGYNGGPLPVLTSGIRVAREYLVCSFSGRDNTT